MKKAAYGKRTYLNFRDDVKLHQEAMAAMNSRECDRTTTTTDYIARCIVIAERYDRVGLGASNGSGAASPGHMQDQKVLKELLEEVIGKYAGQIQETIREAMREKDALAGMDLKKYDGDESSFVNIVYPD